MYVYWTEVQIAPLPLPIASAIQLVATHAAGAELVELAAFAGGAPALRLPRCFLAFGVDVGVEASVAFTASVLVLASVPGAVTSLAFGVG